MKRDGPMWPAWFFTAVTVVTAPKHSLWAGHRTQDLSSVAQHPLQEETEAQRA